MELIKRAYEQGEERVAGGDEQGVSPHDVGHNIYILAHQVSHADNYLKNLLNCFESHLHIVSFVMKLK